MKTFVEFVLGTVAEFEHDPNIESSKEAIEDIELPDGRRAQVSIKIVVDKHDHRWNKMPYYYPVSVPMTYIETLHAMCETYGSFCGRGHSNEFWAKTKAAIAGMTEAQAKEKVFAIENDADGSVEQLRWCQ